MKLVLKTKIHCKICDKVVPIHLFSNEPDFMEKFPSFEEEVKDYGDWMHWVHTHQLCAICGKLVESGELDLVFEKDYRGRVNDQYTKSLKYPDRGLLTVHSTCLK